MTKFSIMLLYGKYYSVANSALSLLPINTGVS